MGRNRGLTLVELAIVLIVLGILLGIGAGIIGVLIKRVKYNESREIVNAAVEGIVGYAITSGRLPDNTNWTSAVRSAKDSYGKDILYVYDSDLTSSGSICGAGGTAITVKICSDTSCASPTQTINNVAFLIISGGGNYNVQTSAPSTCNSSSTCEIRVYEYGVGNVDDYTTDMNRPEPYDDIVKWVSLYELKPKVGCTGSGGGGGGGGGGGCRYGSPITVNNTGGNRTIRTGAAVFFFCSTGSCQNFTSVSISAGDCFVVYGSNNCRNREATYSYDNVYNADTNGDCIVNYNNGTLQDN